ncbi:MAG TPA: DUF1801 domain-containing protein [Gemmatimonas sp.]|nr:DUF1801 domain-containing protein [Gemmatimonas sp.]
MTDKPTTTAQYLDTLSTGQRTVVEQLIAAVREAVPAAEEGFSYGMPLLTLDGQPLVWVAAWKRHYSIYPVTSAQASQAAVPGDEYEAEKGTLRFASNTVVPFGLVARVAQARAAEIDARPQ